jgi:hypothetical protein
MFYSHCLLIIDTVTSIARYVVVQCFAHYVFL